MSLFVVPIPAPAAGADWVTTVPGQYIYDIVAITAQLATGTSTPTVCHDASGAGADLTYEPGQVAFGIPGYVAGDTMVQQTGGPSHFVASGPLDGTFFTANDLFWACWTDANIAVGSGPAMIAYVGSTVSRVFFNLLPDGSGGLLLDAEWTNTDFTFGGALSPPGIPPGAHFYAARYDLALDKVQFYVDGAPYGGLIANSGNPPLIDAAGTLMIGGDPSSTSHPHYDEITLGGNATNDGQYAQLYADRGNFANYSADLIPMGPAAIYHLDDAIPGAGRQVVLDVTDDTHLVTEVPTGFADTTHAGPFSYTWQPNLNSSTQTPDGTITTVATPPLILPAGYTIGTRTLDLGATDQWSNINLWWNTDYMDAVDPGNAYAFPGGVLLRYQREQVPA